VLAFVYDPNSPQWGTSPRKNPNSRACFPKDLSKNKRRPAASIDRAGYLALGAQKQSGLKGRGWNSKSIEKEKLTRYSRIFDLERKPHKI